MLTSAVTAHEVTVRYGERLGLQDVTFSVAEGTTALLGVNGAGKSTLLRVLAGAQRPDNGSVTAAGLDLYARATRTRALESVSLMPQLASFPASMTVLEVVTHIGWLRGMSSRAAAARARACVGRVGLGDRASSRLKELSGGMQRRVALAQALVSEPAVVLLDEPSTGLDPEQRRIMVDLIKDLDSSVLFSSHVVEDVVDVADRVLVLEGGRLVDDLSLDDLLTRGAETSRPHAAAGERAEAGFLSTISRARSERR